MRRWNLIGTLVVGIGVLVGSRQSARANLLTNGDFEAGSLAGWTTSNQPGGQGNFFASQLLVAPISGQPTAGPAGGATYAVSDQANPSGQALTQSFTVGAPSNVTLSFQMFVNNYGPPVTNLTTLNPAGPAAQYARVDILSGSSSPLSTAPADVIATLFAGSDPGAVSHAYTPYTFNITPFVGGGGTYILRFANVENQGAVLNQGIDNVDITAAAITAPVPEPSTYVMMGLGLLMMAGLTRRKRREALAPQLAVLRA